MLDNLLKQFNMTWCQVVSKTSMCNVHMDLHFKLKYVVIL
jgi:ribosome-associated toxin RatA of RatAB toxin-antitoxin module